MFYAAKILPVVFLFLADIVRVIDKIFVLIKKEERKKIEDDPGNPNWIKTSHGRGYFLNSEGNE